MVKAIYVPVNATNIKAVCGRWEICHIISDTGEFTKTIDEWSQPSMVAIHDTIVYHYKSDKLQQTVSKVAVNNFAHDVAYIAHTSGTTRGGQGCGLSVQVPYCALDANLYSISKRLGIKDNPVILWSSAPTFDPSYVELGLALGGYLNINDNQQYNCNGGRLIIISLLMRRTPNRLTTVIQNTGVTLLMMTPSLFTSLDASFISAALQEESTTITDIVLGGEAFPTKWLATRYYHSGRTNKASSKKRRIEQQINDEGYNLISLPRLWNIYGTTECSIWATLHKVNLSVEVTTGTPIGPPLDGIILVIRKIDDNKSKMDGQTIGELVISTEKNRVCRINDELEPLQQRGTGDLVRKDNATQCIYYEGRIDRQVKRWGHRLQLEEIEQQLLVCCPIIEQCALPNTENEQSPGTSRLIAFIQLDSVATKTSTDVQSHLGNTNKANINLSIYAQPDHYIIIPTLPITANGKVDTTKLRQSISIDQLLYSNTSHTQNKHPITLHNIQEHVLQLLSHLQHKKDLVTTNTTDNYYVAMGGTSIEAVRIIHILWEQWIPQSTVITDKVDQQRKLLNILLHKPISTFISAAYHKLLYLHNSNSNNDTDNIEDAISTNQKHTSSNTTITTTAINNNYSTQKPLFIKESIIQRTSSICGPSITALLSTNYSIKWRIDLKKCIDASPIVAYYRYSLSKQQGVAWIGSHAGLLMAIDIEQGSIIWQIELPDRIESTGCLTHSGEYIIIGCYNQCLYVIRALTGHIVNRYKTGSMIKSSPCVDLVNGCIWFGSHDGHLYCLRICPDVEECQLEGKLDCNSPLFSSCIIDTVHRMVITANLRGELWAIHADHIQSHGYSTMTVNWKTAIKDSNHNKVPFFSSPALATDGQRILIGSANGYLYCFASQDGSILWRYNSHGPIFSSPCIWHDNVIVGSHAGTLICCSISSGALIWQATIPTTEHNTTQSTRTPVYASPFLITHCSSNNASKEEWCAIIASTDGRLFAVDGQSGTLYLWITLPGEVFSSPICIYNNSNTNSNRMKKQPPITVLIGCRDNGFYAIN
ncbi:hypothetical protein BDF19DRAFT_414552 [Syncephalis fuscata]|nr:hypothetical protein BDF19DRAFT_414552 [Syncephalis fuscata]